MFTQGIVYITVRTGTTLLCYSIKGLSVLILLFDSVNKELEHFLNISLKISRFWCLLFEIPTECLKKEAISQLPKIEELPFTWSVNMFV